AFCPACRVPLTPLSFVPPGGWNERQWEPERRNGREGRGGERRVRRAGWGWAGLLFLQGFGQHNDARMNLAIALTAGRYGAAIANYTEVVHLLKRADPQTGKERVCGAHCRDVITGQEFDVRAKCVINATGPFTDALWKMDDQKNPDICQPSAGVHIVIPGYYSPACSCPPLPSRPKVNAVFLFVPLPTRASSHAHNMNTPPVLYEHGAPGSRHVISFLGKDAQAHPHGARRRCAGEHQLHPDGSRQLSSCLRRDVGGDYGKSVKYTK
ncbi:Glycerol-3-phosphate dehydrogenase, partial [Nibea albiflora]